MEIEKSGGSAFVESEDVLRNRMFRLCGFVLVVVKVRRDGLELAGSGLDPLVGAKCSLQGRGSEVHVRVEESELCLWPLVAEDVRIDDDQRGQNSERFAEIATGSTGSVPLNSPLIVSSESLRDGNVVDDVPTEFAPSATAGAGTGGKRKRGGLGSVNGSGDGLLYQMQWLCGKNNARVQGRILTVARKSDETRAVAMLDLYLPASAWMGACFWKSGATAAAVLSHLRSGLNLQNTNLYKFQNISLIAPKANCSNYQ